MNKLKQTAKTILIFILCSATCFLSIGCGEDLTFEDGEYTAELVAQYAMFSSYVSGFKIEIKNNELIDHDRDLNYGELTKDKVNKRSWMEPTFYETYNEFDFEKLKKVNVCVKTDYLADGESYYCLLKNDENIYLIDTSTRSGKARFLKIWLLKKSY